MESVYLIKGSSVFDDQLINYLNKYISLVFMFIV